MTGVLEWFPPWLFPLLSLLGAALIVIHLLGGHIWMYVLLGLGLVAGVVWVVWRRQLVDAVFRVRVRLAHIEEE